MEEMVMEVIMEEVTEVDLVASGGQLEQLFWRKKVWGLRKVCKEEYGGGGREKSVKIWRTIEMSQKMSNNIDIVGLPRKIKMEK